MKTLLLPVFLFLSMAVVACSGIPKSFCFVKSQRPSDVIITGVILANTSHSLQLSVIEVLRGVETRSVVTIWDGTDYECNGTVSMQVADMGFAGDTIIAILPLIVSTQNSWDITGDYRRPVTFFETAWLKVKKDSVRGYFSGSPYTPIEKYPYTSFKSYLQDQSKDCFTLSISEVQENEVKVTVRNGNIVLNSLSGEKFEVKLHGVDGRLLAALKPSEEHVLNAAHLPSGIYLLTILSDNNRARIQKLML